MASYKPSNPYYPPPPNVHFSGGIPPSQPTQQQPGFSYGYGARPTPETSSQNPPYSPYMQQSSPQQTQQLLPQSPEFRTYAQEPPPPVQQQGQYQYQYPPQTQQSSYNSPPAALMAPAPSNRRDRRESLDNSLRAPAYERRHSSNSTHSHRSNKSRRSSRSRYSEDGRHYTTKTGEVIDVDSLDKHRSYGDSVVFVWNALKGIMGRRE